MVVKRSGELVPFDPQKLRARHRARGRGECDRRAAIDALAHEVEEKARAAGPEVRSEIIGLAVLEGLRQLDLVSYMRFASVYKGFDTVEDFEARAGRAPEVDRAEGPSEPDQSRFFGPVETRKPCNDTAVVLPLSSHH